MPKFCFYLASYLLKFWYCFSHFKTSVCCVYQNSGLSAEPLQVVGSRVLFVCFDCFKPSDSLSSLILMDKIDDKHPWDKCGLHLVYYKCTYYNTKSN